ncbi:MAG: amidase family protein [Candidatus Acidiferrum sp.]
MKRRDFVTTVTLGLTAGLPAFAENSLADFEAGSASANVIRQTSDRATSPTGRLEFASAQEAAEAIRKKHISSFELTQQTFARIDKYNPQLNAFAYQLREDALARAMQADEAQARGKSLGVLHGVPVHVKESFAVAGHPCTWGIPTLKDSKAPSDSEVVTRFRNEGAVLIGATNVPISLGDWQSYNRIYGTTNNPWDVKRSPGGSSGGSAAALATGLGYLSVGSDIGGSIRVPAHFCGVYGHKPTLDLVSTQGQRPGGQHDNPGFSTLLAVGGPMARSAEDLLAALRFLGGPADYSAKAWKWELPAARHESLREFRVGYVLDDPYCPVTPGTKAVLENTIQKLEKAGAKLKPGWPAGFKIEELNQNYNFHLDAFIFSVEPAEQQEAERKVAAANGEAVPGLASFADWQRQNFRRLGYRAQWQSYFDDVDVFLSPVAFTTAFVHDHSEPHNKRTIATVHGPRAYDDMLRWIAPATLTGCPATAAPVGRDEGGLPIGLQVMGPYWEDATPIVFAKLLARELGGFVAPSGYAG